MFSPHWISTHRGNLGNVTDRDIFVSWNPGMFKTLTVDTRVPYLEDVPPSAQFILVRNHPMSEDGNRGQTADFSVAPPIAELPPAAISLDAPPGARPPLFDVQADAMPQASAETPYQRGLRHAVICDEMARYCESKGVPRSRLRFEGLNEPQLWSGEPPVWTADYYRGFLVGLHSYNLLGVVGNFGVGWPGNGGVQDAPVDWRFFQPVINEFRAGDYLGLHEYWALNGPGENWRWWAGRFLQCPFKVPILITETGIDTGVTGQWYGGWRDLPGGSEKEKAVRYSNELVWYAQQCRNDGRVQQVFPFTYDIGSSEWEKFDIRNQPFLEAFFAVKDQVRNPPPPPPPPPPGLENQIRNRAWDLQGIPYNKDAALARYAREKGLGNPVTVEFDVAGQRAQGFARKIVYAPIGQWSDIKEMDW